MSALMTLGLTWSATCHGSGTVGGDGVLSPRHGCRGQFVSLNRSTPPWQMRCRGAGYHSSFFINPKHTDWATVSCIWCLNHTPPPPSIPLFWLFLLLLSWSRFLPVNGKLSLLVEESGWICFGQGSSKMIVLSIFSFINPAGDILQFWG